MQKKRKEKKSMSYQSSKHLLRQCHLNREVIEMKYIKIKCVTVKDNLADPLTKIFFQWKNDHHMERYDIQYMSNWI